MSYAKLLYVDRVEDSVAVFATSENTSTPGTNATTPNRSTVWRSVPGVNPVTIVFDVGAEYSISAVAMLSTNLSAAGTRRIRTSANRDLSAATYDSTAAIPGAELDTVTGQLVHILPTPQITGGVSSFLLREDGSYVLREDGGKIPLEETGNFVGITLDDASLDYHEIGKVVAGAVSSPTHNYAYGWQWIAIDPSAVTQAIGGASYVDLRSIRRGVDVAFEALTDAEARGFAYEIITQRGRGRPVRGVLDPASTNVGRDTVWGLIDGELAVVFTTQGVRAWRLRVIERF